MKYPCSKNVCEKTIFCFSLLLFQRILNAFLYDLYHEIGHILTCPCHYRYIYNNTNTTRVIKSMEVYLSTHRDPLSILKSNRQNMHVDKQIFSEIAPIVSMITISILQWP